MTDFFAPHVDSPKGATHTGSGDINITMGPGSRESDGPAFRRIAEDQLRWLRRVLVPPVNMGRARSVLADTGTVILDGALGAGRTCAARVLLREHHRDAGTLHELQPEEEDELPLHDPDLVEAGDQLLLDLSADVSRWDRMSRDLSALRKTVHDRRAHLVVVVPHGIPLDPDLEHYRVVIKAPDSLSVFMRHLRVHGLPYEEFARPDAAITSFLRERPMRDIAAFADLVRRAREAEPEEAFAYWCDQAAKARSDRRSQAADMVATLREAPQRALLISVAMLHGAHADVIHRAAQLLLRGVGSPPAELTPLEHKDLSERFKEINATSDVRGRVRFSELDYDTAVRTHFWDHVPDLRPHLGTWAAQLMDLNDPHMTAEVRGQLVARLAGQYLRTERGEALVVLAESWSSQAASRQSRQAAVQALACGLNDPMQGGRLRNLIYQWCTERRLRGAFGPVLIRVCAEVIGASHPDQALTRLYHLARRERDTTLALQALRELVATSRRLRRRLLDCLTRSDITPATLAVFLGTCDPQPLTEPGQAARALVQEHAVRRSLTTCWAGVLAVLPRAQWYRQIEGWLWSAASGGEETGELLLDILVSAADRCEEDRGTVFAVLFACAREAERSGQADTRRSAAITELLLTKIRAAQGLGPTISATASSRGTRP